MREFRHDKGAVMEDHRTSHKHAGEELGKEYDKTESMEANASSISFPDSLFTLISIQRPPLQLLQASTSILHRVVPPHQKSKGMYNLWSAQKVWSRVADNAATADRLLILY